MKTAKLMSFLKAALLLTLLSVTTAQANIVTVNGQGLDVPTQKTILKKPPFNDEGPGQGGGK